MHAHVTININGMSNNDKQKMSKWNSIDKHGHINLGNIKKNVFK